MSNIGTRIARTVLKKNLNNIFTIKTNAAMEGFFGLLKRERINRRIYQTRAEARAPDAGGDLKRPSRRNYS